MDIENPGTALDRTGHPNPVPRVVGPIRRKRPVEVRDVEVLRANTDRTINATLPGPFTMSQQAQDDYYKDEEGLAMALAEAVNAVLLCVPVPVGPLLNTRPCGSTAMSGSPFV